MPRELPRSFYVIFILILLAANVWLYQTLLSSREPEVVIFDTGESRAALVRTPDNITILIDTGKDAGILRALGEVLSPWRRSIDVVVLTDASARFGGGLPDVLNRYRVPNLVRFGAEGSKSFEAALAAALGRKEGLYQTRAPYGARLRFGEVSIGIISPGTFSISFGSASLHVSSTTLKGLYVLNGRGVKKD